ncbi:LysR family transcriptional regulator [Amycolatopsis kentuckyensis]|uniref:LysR family transcriptional regulator n=1 Tax=Amycolatopsis kentuckyensis TaxID=218823 RepID=UPI00356421C3
MDLVGGCRAFVSVSEAGSFTAGAAVARIPQPVASRRIAALERHFGERLFDRSTRRARLTPFGRDVLPSAKRLVQLADTLEHDARRARLRPMRVAVPDTCGVRELAELAAAARALEVHLEFRVAPPGERADLVRTQEVRAAFVAVPADEGAWSVPLGLAGVVAPKARVVHLETLRAGRSGGPRRHVWIQPEDDVPHVRDPLLRARDAVGLPPAQVEVAGSLTAAAAAVFGSADLLLCSRAQTSELGLHWRPIGEVAPARGFAVVGEDAERLRALAPAIGRCLGAEA